jgi:hypothetical protein
MTDKCNWKHTPFATPYMHPITRMPMPGFPDEWTIGCCTAGTLRTEPRKEWKLCPYCGKEINFLSDTADPSLPQTIPRVV